MNNPLMYNDPDGEFLMWFAGALVGGYLNGVQANGSWNPTKWNWEKTWSAVLGGAIGGAAISGALGNITSNAGAIKSFLPGIVSGGLSSAFNGSNFLGGAIGGISYSGNLFTNKVTSTNMADAGYRYIVSPNDVYGDDWNGDDCPKCPKPGRNSTFGNKPDRGSEWAKASLAFMATDIAIPDPSDAAWPKWAGYAVVGATAGSYLYYKKMTKEIDGIEKRNLKPQGVLYQLEATRSGFYTNVRGGTVYLSVGDVWKYGETTKASRYSEAYLTSMGLQQRNIFQGTQSAIKIQEKIMIYGYFMVNGSLPPGNKIFR